MFKTSDQESASLLQRSSHVLQAREVRLQSAGGPTLYVSALLERGPACVLIHGHADGGFVWDEFRPVLAQRYGTVVPDLRGHGDSDWDDRGRYDVQAHAADVARVLDDCLTGSFILIGHSLGAHIATHLCARYALRVAALVLVDFGPSLNADGMSHARAQLLESLRLYDSVESYAGWLASRRPLTEPAILEHIARRAMRPVTGGFRLKIDPALAAAGSLDAAEEQRLWQMLRGAACPTLIVRGKGSAVFPHAVALRMLDVLARGELATVAHSGHSVMLDNPRGFSDAVLAFLAKHVARTDPG